MLNHAIGKDFIKVVDVIVIKSIPKCPVSILYKNHTTIKQKNR